MSRHFLFLRLAIGFGLLQATPIAEAQGGSPACAQRDQVVARLEQRFGETPHSQGVQQNDALVELFASDTTGTWTILMTSPNGLSCLLAAGRLWKTGPAPVPERGEAI